MCEGGQGLINNRDNTVNLEVQKDHQVFHCQKTHKSSSFKFLTRK